MKKLIVAFLILYIAGNVSAQDSPDEQYIIIPSGEIFMESPALSDVIEAVGSLIYSTTVYTEPSKTSKSVRTAIAGEKIIVTATGDEWCSIRMYNGKTGYVDKRAVKTVKVFYDEIVTRNYMDKRINVELEDLIERFNRVLKFSYYAEKYKLIPQLTLISSSKQKNIITLTLEYSAIDEFGSTVPSRQDNTLQQQMIDFLEVLFLKMLPANADSYIINITKPTFSDSGQVLNTQGVYASIELPHENIDISGIKDKKIKLISYARPSVELDELFKTFPN